MGLLALLLASYLSVQIPVYVKLIINGLEAEITWEMIHRYCLWILVLAGIKAVLIFLTRWLIIGASRSIEMNLRNDFYRHIQSLTPRFYHSMKTGDLVTRFSSDIEQARLLIGPGIMYPGTTLFMMSLALYSMFILNAGLTLTLLIPIGLLMGYVNYNTRILHRLYQRAQETYSDLTAKVQENFSGIRVIKAYCQEEAEIERFRDINDEYMRRNIAQIKMRGALFAILNFIGGLGIVLILWRGGMKVIGGTLDLGELVQFIIYYQMLMWPIIAMGWIINVIHRGFASWKRIHSIMETRPEIEMTPVPQGYPSLKGAIELRDLTFAYDSQTEPVLKNISFRVEPGETLAIVGPTGCGKTTIVNLLLHLYTVPPGTIFFDEKDINDIPLPALRESIAYVSQEVFLFSDTIRNNILLGTTDPERIDVSEINEAAERAQLIREVEGFPNGFETEIGERGITLSGGQKQRTGIARALILQRPILILDDCLSSVDTSTEDAILNGLKDAMVSSTSIIISHRISTVKNADRIIVLDRGRLIEEGAHDDLIEAGGLYARIHRRQLLEESLSIRS